MRPGLRLLRRPWPGSLRSQLLALFLGLLALLLVAGCAALGAGLAGQARAGLPAQLELGERVLGRLLDQRAQILLDGARLLARDPAFRAAAQSHDSLALASVLENAGERSGATELAWLDPGFAPRAAAGTPLQRRELAGAAAELALRAAAGGRASGLALLAGRPHQMVLVPMEAPGPAGWVLLGVAVDERLGREMHQLSALHLTLLTRSARGAPWQSALSTLAPPQAQRLAAQPWPAPGEAATGMRAVAVDGEELGVQARWLTPPAAPDAVPETAVLALVSLSIDAATRTPRELQLGLLALALAGFAVVAAGSVVAARRVTTPLGTLGAAVERLGAGDYVTPVPALSRRDEIGTLAQALETMRARVADQDTQIRRLAYWDRLTGLPNRALLHDAALEAIEQARGAGGSVALLVLDLDRFKQVNEVLGPSVGDQLLKGVAERLTQQVLRGHDLVARLPGDAFAVLLRDGDAVLARSVAQRIARAFDRPMQLQDHQVDLGAAIGMACWPEQAADADSLLQCAELALQSAKRGAAGPQLYDAATDAGSAAALGLLAQLQHAVDHGELRLLLQPRLSLDDGQVVGAEALLHWQHPQRGLLAPLQFIPVAAQTGLMRRLTTWVFEEAARLWLALQAQGTLLKLSFRLSSGDLLDAELPARLDALLVRHRVPAEAFCLEITERVIMEDPQRALAGLTRLGAMGFKLSIDEFGSGWTSLACLKRLPVDELKIDRSFVRGMERDLDDAAIVRSTIDLAHHLGLTVVAEGVENARAWDLLRELRCDDAQGEHMGPPMPADEFGKWSALWVERRRPFAASSPMRLH